jgi:hypothetical protein
MADTSTPNLRARCSSDGNDGIRRDLAAAREAYNNNDTLFSRRAHALTAQSLHIEGDLAPSRRSDAVDPVCNPGPASPIFTSLPSPTPPISAQSMLTPPVYNGAAAPSSPPKELPYTELGHDASETSVGKSALGASLDGAVTIVTLVMLAMCLELSTAQLEKLLGGAVVALTVAAACREYARFSADYSHFYRECARERWELDNFPQGTWSHPLSVHYSCIVPCAPCVAGEEGEMVELYQGKGVAAPDALAAIRALSKYPDVFVELMMVQELGLALVRAIVLPLPRFSPLLTSR